MRHRPTTFGLERALAADDIACVVAAPSKLIRPSGHRIKTKVRDAAHLTRLLLLLRLGEITAVSVPDADVEAVRSGRCPRRRPRRPDTRLAQRLVGS